ncbi:MAG: SRPBCC family protein [Saprospiraceae bacterium]|nr:SRPBCC family protein [Saprospiraceae bacterium]
MTTVTITAHITAKINKVWEYWTSPHHIIRWNFASPEWHCPTAEHDLQVGGNFKYHMAAKDGSMGFDYKGTFTQIQPEKVLAFTLEDNRKVSITFEETENGTRVTETFEIEDENTIEMQKQGWQAILNNFKAHVEA